MRIVVLSVLCFALAASERTLFSVTTTSQNTNVSISFNAAGGKGSADIPLNDSRVLPAATGVPEQVSPACIACMSRNFFVLPTCRQAYRGSLF